MWSSRGQGVSLPHRSFGTEPAACLSVSSELDAKSSRTCPQCPRQEAIWFLGSQDAWSFSLNHFLHMTQICAASWEKKTCFGLSVHAMWHMTPPKWLPCWVEREPQSRGGWESLESSFFIMFAHHLAKGKSLQQFHNWDWSLESLLPHFSISLFVARVRASRLTPRDRSPGSAGEGAKDRSTWKKFTGLALYSPLTRAQTLWSLTGYKVQLNQSWAQSEANNHA